MLWYLLATLAVIIFYILVFMRQRTWLKRNVKQVCTTPLFGDHFGSIIRTESFAEMIRRVYNVFPNERYIGIHQITSPTLMVRDPELIKKLLIKDFDYFSNRRSFGDSNIEPLFSKNLAALKGEEWRDMRSTLSPAFTGSKMRAMFTLINDCAKQFTTYYLNKNEKKIELEMKDTFTRYANDVIATCAFGVTVDSLREPKNEFYMYGKETTNFSGLIRSFKFGLFMFAPKISKFFKIRIFSEEVCNFFKKLVSNTIHIRESQHIVRPDMINLLMEARKGKLRHEEISEVNDTGFATVEESNIGKVEKSQPREITDLDIAGQALIFFFAGFDAVSSGMCFFAYELAVNPDIQEKLIAEVDKTFRACNGDITYDSLMKMQYMDMVISEVFRKWPPGVGADRTCTRPYTIQPVKLGEQPVEINVGEALWIPIIGLHFDPEYYENPDTFDPERFSDENKHKINPYAYMPFGAGPRNCIGSRFAIMEVKVAIFNILTKFKFVPTEKSVIPLKIDKKQINLSSEGGFWMAMERR